MATRADSFVLNRRPVPPVTAPPLMATVDTNGTSNATAALASVDLGPVVTTRGLAAINVAGNFTFTPAHVVNSMIVTGATVAVNNLFTMPTAAEIVRYLDANRLLPSTPLIAAGNPNAALTLPGLMATNATLPVLCAAFDFSFRHYGGEDVAIVWNTGNYYHATAEAAGSNANLTVTTTTVLNLRAYIGTVNPAQIEWYLI